MATDHTPGPYTSEAGGKRGAWVAGVNRSWICLSCGESDSEAEANTAFILRALNAHYDLVAALTAVRFELEDYEKAATGKAYDSTQINAALAKAEAL